jgi:Xaa-Pro aminopeptidase
MDFGVKINGYCSDLQRTWYVLKEDETEAPFDVRKGFETIKTSIELSKQAMQPGMKGYEIDKIARDYIISQGYDEFQHGLGHQVGKFAHDGYALLGPLWEKYASKVLVPLEKGMVFTIEPKFLIKNRGVVTAEEMVVITENGAEYLSKRQEELILIK